MNRFNIALLPIDPEQQKLFIEIAQACFKNIADGYILGTNALAHVTLCQFRAPDENTAISAFRALRYRSKLVLSLDKFHLRKGQEEHEGKYWAEFLMIKSPEIIQEQTACFKHIKDAGLMPLTPVEGYAPHITLARVPSSAISNPEVYPHSVAVRPAVGLSTENGVFVRALAQNATL